MSGKSTLVNSKVNNNDKVSTTSEKDSFYGYACFVLCTSCFWCASDLSGGSRVQKCHACDIAKIESIPLAPKEQYAFEFEPKRGIVLDFAPHH
jgi:hypothetical protein